MAKKEEIIAIEEFRPKVFEVEITGDSDLICNKMNDVTVKALTDIRTDKKKSLEKPSMWEEIITSIHWFNGKPKEFDQDSMVEALTNNKPCFTSFGMMKSIGQAVVRFGYDTYATKFNASTNFITKGGLIPFEFEEHFIDEKLMQPKQGKPVLARLNHFTNWKATLTISFIDSVYSIEQIVNFINAAGFGIGIGSGRTSGYGRYHVTGVKQI